MNKGSGGDGIPAELFQILKDDAVQCYTQYVSKFGKLNIQKRRSQHLVPSLHGKINGETMEAVRDFIFWAPKSLDGDCSHEIKRYLLLRRKAMRNLDSVLKSKDITLPTTFRIVKAMVFLVVTY